VPARRVPEQILFSTMSEARTALAAWKVDYNASRPHSGLGHITPNEFAARFALTQEAARRHQFNLGLYLLSGW
jgi:hypothetical protein